MICEAKKVLFIHIPKTGGSTVTTRIGPELFDHKNPKDFFNKKKEYFVVQKKWAQHFSYQEYSEYYKNISSFFSFAFVRNPWDRIVSEYLYTKKFGGSCKEPQQFSFESFLEKNMPCSFMRHKWGQKKFLEDKNGNIAVKKIYKFESFEEEFAKLKVELNLKNNSKRSALINKDRLPYQAYYNSATKEMADEILKEDIELLGYKFENQTKEKQIYHH